MKKILTILFFTIISFSKNTKAQSGVPDTLEYLQTIIANKAQYIGQPFSKQFDSLNLNIQIEYFHPKRGGFRDSNAETATLFAFYYPETENELYLIYPCLEVHWQIPLNANQSFSLYNANNAGQWATSILNYYKSTVIKDIEIFE